MWSFSPPRTGKRSDELLFHANSSIGEFSSSMRAKAVGAAAVDGGRLTGFCQLDLIAPK
jgi:hypothetical protein